MAAAKKFRDHYPKESGEKASQSSPKQDKASIEIYKKKIEAELEKRPELAKKAANILGHWINSKK